MVSFLDGFTVASSGGGFFPDDDLGQLMADPFTQVAPCAVP